MTSFDSRSVARDGSAKPTLPSDPAGAFKAINRTFIDDSSGADAGGDKVRQGAERGGAAREEAGGAGGED